LPNSSQLLTAYDDQLRGAFLLNLPPGAHEEQDGPVFRSWGWMPRGFVIHRDLSQLTDAELESLIVRQCDYFAERDLAFEWKTFSQDRPADFPERLLAAGFVPEERENLVIGLVSEMDQEPDLPAGVSLREIDSPADMARLTEMLSEVWGEDLGYLGQMFLRELEANPGHVVVLVAEAAGKVVASARVNLVAGTDFATLWAGSTRPEWRGRGIYRATVAYRARLAARRGRSYLQVDASEQSRPILERLGFITVASTTPYIWSPPAA
jgi:GNAT superfamily N-acetyltransferase